MRTTIKVEGMKCEGCENNIKNALGSMDGVKSVEADHMDAIVVVEHEGIDVKRIEDKIVELGFSVG